MLLTKVDKKASSLAVKKSKIEVTKNSLKAFISIDVIAQITGPSLDEIKQLNLKK